MLRANYKESRNVGMTWEYWRLLQQTLAPSAEILRCLFRKLAAREGGHSADSGGALFNNYFLLLFPAHKQWGTEPKVNCPERKNRLCLPSSFGPGNSRREPREPWSSEDKRYGQKDCGMFIYFSEQQLFGKICRKVIKIPLLL